MDRPTWGDTIRINDDAPDDMRPGWLAAVCGMRELENDDQAKQFERAIGSRVLLVEFGDGHAIELPEDLVAIAND